MLKIITLTLLMSILAFAYSHNPKTGQKYSFDNYGVNVIDESIKDDGYYQMGITRNYSRSGDVVIDKATGLYWQDNESSGRMEGDDAASYCQDLSLNGLNWRVPTMHELRTLVDFSKRDPSVTDGVFNYINTSSYWSSTVAAFWYPNNRWYMNFYLGFQDYDFSHGDNYYYVRCVSVGKADLSNFTRDDATQIVTDHTTKLQWQDDSTATESRSWEAAINYCENTLDLGGYNDWRLPNINELYSIVDYSEDDPAMDIGVFINVSYIPEYWSSTSRMDSHGHAYTVFFNSGKTLYENKIYRNDVRCVRGGEKTCRLKQGTDICMSGSPVANPGAYLPNCDNGQLVQGTNTCDEDAIPVDPPGLFLPVCPDGEWLTQGTTNQCN